MNETSPSEGLVAGGLKGPPQAASNGRADGGGMPANREITANGRGHGDELGGETTSRDPAAPIPETEPKPDEREGASSATTDATATFPVQKLSRAEQIAATKAEGLARRAELLASMPTSGPIQSGSDKQLEPEPPDFRRPQRARRAPKGIKRWTALFCIVLPTILASIYYFGIATDQYMAEADFVIGTQNSGSISKSSGGLSSLGSSSSAMSIVDVYVVRDYVGSLKMLQDLQPYLDLRKIYSNPSADRLSRIDPDIPDEKLLTFWNSVVSVNYDMLSGICTLRVRAFTPQDTKEIADRVLFLSENLVNRLSDRARADAVKQAKDEVDLAYERASKARDEMQAFSQTTEQISPQALVQSNASIQATLQSDLINSESQLALLRKSLPEDAPGVRQIKDHIAIVEDQLTAEKTKATTKQNGKSPNEVANNFAKLMTENDFASQAYITAQNYLESVQLQAVGQQSYLEVFVPPQLPQISTYPARLNTVVLVAAIGVLAWAILSLLITAAREHAN